MKLKNSLIFIIFMVLLFTTFQMWKWKQLEELKRAKGYYPPDLMKIAREIGPATGTLSIQDHQRGGYYEISAMIIDDQGYILTMGHFAESVQQCLGFNALNDVKFLWAPNESTKRVAIPVKFVKASPLNQYDLALFKLNPRDFFQLTEKEMRVITFGNSDKIETLSHPSDINEFYGRYGGVVSSPGGLYFSLTPVSVSYPRRCPEFLREKYGSVAAPYECQYLIELSVEMGRGSSGGLFFIGNKCFGAITRVNKLEKYTFVIPSIEILRWLHKVDKELNLKLQLSFEK